MLLKNVSIEDVVLRASDLYGTQKGSIDSNQWGKPEEYEAGDYVKGQVYYTGSPNLAYLSEQTLHHLPGVNFHRIQ